MSLKNKKGPFIIGETAYNHQGELDYLRRMIDDIADLRLEAIKFHVSLDINSYMQKKHPLFKEAKKWNFKNESWREILQYAQLKDIEIIVLCNTIPSVEFINKEFSDIFAIEIHATSLNDYYLLQKATEFKRTVILGIGGSTLDEIYYAIKILKAKGKRDIILMYGFQSYPTNYEEINLSKMLKLKELFELPIGYADHTAYDDPNNEIISSMAAMMGVNILEKHYTPDYGKKRIDYQSAVGKNQMIRIKELTKLALTVYGTGSLELSESEQKYGNTGPMKKAIVAKRKIMKGEKLSFENLWFKRTMEESLIKQNMFLQLIGLEAILDFEKDEIISFPKVKC